MPPLVLDGTNGVSGVDGTASNPSLEGTDSNTGVFFPAADTVAIATGGTERVRVNSAGNTQTVGTISVGNATPSTSGAGITFPATQSASSDANTLDDYEEGTWTPAVNNGSGTTYTTQQGKYTKVGNVVTVGFELTVNAKGTITGNAQITGLPFTSASPNNRTSGSLSVANTTGTAYVSQGIFLDANSTILDLYAKTAAATSNSPQPTGTAFFAAGTQLIGSVTYFTA